MTRDHYLIAAAVRIGWRLTKEHFFYLLGLIILGVIFGIGPQPLVRYGVEYGNAIADYSNILLIILGIIYFIGRILLQMGIIKMTVAFVDGAKPTYRELITGFDRFFPFLIGQILYILIVCVGIILFIVPGIIWALQYQFSSYLIVEKKRPILEAFKESSQLTRDVKWELFGLGAVLMVINILGAITVVGVLLTIPLTWLTRAYVYRRVQND